MQNAVDAAKRLLADKDLPKDLAAVCKSLIDAEWVILEYSEKDYHSHEWSNDHIQGSALNWLENNAGLAGVRD